MGCSSSCPMKYRKRRNPAPSGSSYGSLLPELIDGPINPLMRMRVMAASVMALARWEPRIQVNQVDFASTGIDGGAVLELHGERTDGPRAGTPFSMRLPMMGGRATGRGTA